MPRAVGLPAVRLTGSRVVGFRVDGIEEVTERFAVIESRFKNPGPVLEVVVDNIEAHVHRGFDSEGASIRGRWAHLRPSTLRARRHRWGYYKRAPRGRVGTLQWSQDLRSSFRRGRLNNIRQVTRSGFAFGSRDRNAVHNQRKRPMVGFRDARQRRELILNPLKMYLRGLSVAEIRAISRERAGFA